MNRIFTIIISLFCGVGAVGNLISIVICSRTEMRKIPTFIFMAFQSLINILKLLTVAISFTVLQFFIKNIETSQSIFYKIGIFLIFWLYQSVAYLKGIGLYLINLN